MNLPFKEINNVKTLAVFILCIGILIVIPVYWFFLVPPAMELQEIHQDSYTATGYLAPGGYLNLEIDLGEESIQGYHNGAVNVLPNTTITQNGTIWPPQDLRVDQWPGSKEEIKYSSNGPLNKEMYLNIKVDIPNQTSLKGQTIPLNIRYDFNYPFQTGLTEVLGGTATNFETRTEVFQKTIQLKLNNEVMTQKDLEVISMNETWKKVLSVIIWIIDLLFLIFVFTDFEMVDKIKDKFKRFSVKILKSLKLIK
ncbi:MAG: hypothetical protein LLF83_07120 [Methanobacterium sp.]|nr:hypothetical protein [Methanobacterium sp.]